MVLNLSWKIGQEADGTVTESALAAAQRGNDFQFGWFADPLTTGDYPQSMRDALGTIQAGVPLRLSLSLCVSVSLAVGQSARPAGGRADCPRASPPKFFEMYFWGLVRASARGRPRADTFVRADVPRQPPINLRFFAISSQISTIL